MDTRRGGGRWRTILTVYAAWWITLIVAGTLGSARLVASAERQPYGPVRDQLVAGARSVHALSMRLGLDDPARALARLQGGPLDAPAGAEAPSAPPVDAESPAGPTARADRAAPDPVGMATAAALPPSRAATSSRRGGSPTATRAVAGLRATPSPTRPVGPRRITPDEPLRVHVAGDSFAEPLGYQLATYATRDRLLSIGMDFRISTGLVRRDYFDWQARMVETLAAPMPPEVVVFFLGANEDQNMLADGDEVLLMGSDPWRAEYQRRAGAMMDLFEPAGVALIWVGVPDMRDERMASAMVAMTRAVETAAGPRPWVTFVDTRPIFRGPEGGFSAFLPSPGGEPVKMRGDDGIHLTRPGTNLVAEVVYALLTRGWDLRTPTPTRTATATATPAPTRTASATATPAPSRTASATMPPAPTPTVPATRGILATTAPTPQSPGSADRAARATVAPGP